MKDPKFLEAIRKLPCISCGKDGPSEAHHIAHQKYKKTGPGDQAWNVLPLCVFCHTVGETAWHLIGPIRFFELRPWVKSYMEAMGWEFTERKIWHPGQQENVGVHTQKL